MPWRNWSRSPDIEIAPATGAPQDGGGARMGDFTDGKRRCGGMTAPWAILRMPRSHRMRCLSRSPWRCGGVAQVYDEIQQPLEVEATDDVDTATVEKSVTELDTMGGLTPVNPKTSWTYLLAGAAWLRVLVLGLGSLALWQDWGGLKGKILGEEAAKVQTVGLAQTAEDVHQEASSRLAMTAESWSDPPGPTPRRPVFGVKKRAPRVLRMRG